MSEIEAVERVFNDAAPQYDDTISANGWPAHNMLGEALAIQHPVKHALDLGAGTGLSSDVILEVTQPERITAVDISEAMLERLQRRHEGDPRLTIVKMAIERFLAETPVRFDLAVAMGVAHFIRDFDVVISGVARVLNDEGRFIFTYNPFISGHPTQGESRSTSGLTFYRRSPADIENALDRSGFKVVSNQLFAANREHQNGFVVAKKPSSPHAVLAEVQVRPVARGGAANPFS
ncbi:MAG TPA: methyltransferase [Candidatus Saccharimonadales bacterium]|nr:methyltransferase [Candidatus Saccharimonadales bacterium]